MNYYVPIKYHKLVSSLSRSHWISMEHLFKAICADEM